ncbi:MAG: PIN domain-containing protein [Halobacteriales archaeon]
MATVVALDTSALTMPVELDVRLFDELERHLGAVEPVAPEAVRDELERLAVGRGRVRTAARVGLDLLERRCRVLETTASIADEAVLELATTGPATHLATADRELARRALDAGVTVFSPRGGQHLAVERP